MVGAGVDLKDAHCTGRDECIYGGSRTGQARAGTGAGTVPEYSARQCQTVPEPVPEHHTRLPDHPAPDHPAPDIWLNWSREVSQVFSYSVVDILVLTLGISNLWLNLSNRPY